MDIRLSEASQLGNISTLYTQITEDPYVLDKIDEPPFGTTPIHIAAENGQIEFATAVMYLKPSFASKLDQNLFTPMHLALQKGKTEMVLWLLRLDSDLVRIKGRDGMTPFLYAVGRGNLDILIAFLLACPDCIKDINVRGENALHIALKCNCFEAFKVLLGWVRKSIHPNSDIWEKELFKGTDKEGNTVLHTAASVMHHEIIQLLEKYYPVQRMVKNLEGLTPQDILQYNVRQGQAQARNNLQGLTPQDIIRHQERHVQELARSLKSLKLLRWSSYFDEPDISNNPETLKKEVSKFKDFTTFIARNRMKIDGDTRNAMLVVTILVITIVFQGVYSPAGGLWPTEDSNNMTTSPICNITCTNNTISPSCNVTCNTNNTISPSCNVTCNTNKPIPSSTTKSPRPGTAVMDKKIFRLAWIFNICTLILAYALTIYLLPPGYADKLFNAILLGLASLYALALSTVSPVPYLGSLTLYLFLCFYALAVVILSSPHSIIQMMFIPSGPIVNIIVKYFKSRR